MNLLHCDFLFGPLQGRQQSGLEDRSVGRQCRKVCDVGVFFSLRGCYDFNHKELKTHSWGVAQLIKGCIGL